MNPDGILAWAYIAKLKGEIVHQDVKIHGWGKGMTNNIGEYLAVVGAMLWLSELPKERQMPAIINSDSQLIVNQCSETWNCNDKTLQKYNRMILAAKAKYRCNISFHWIPREKNKEVDALSRSLYTEEAINIMKERRLDILFDGDDISF